LREATQHGWTARGFDIDPGAVQFSRENAAGALAEAGDVRALALPDGSVSACVSNLPFGKQYGVEGEMGSWLRQALAEIARVVRPGGTVVLLAPEIPPAAHGRVLTLRDRHHVRLLGTATTIWVFDRS
jgi:tRNA G10  N-methylase Trm11